ncbi:MAG: LemA protein [Bacteroidales bacterium]|jgi:LemA protein|nr:LemA protein [Bacteroidales bacterium]NLH52513.1 LemA family protein [Bacteroidales bacterium]NPV36758.1 LemA family protein [Bacteroidales bacterium]
MKKGLIITLVIVFVILVFIFQGIGMYNSLVKSEEAVNAQWANVENVYQRRADLIPNLVNTVKGYANFEQKTLTDVIEARAKATSVQINPEKLDEASLQKFQAAQDGLSSALARLMVVVERYPDLKANQNFLELQSQLEGTENRIAVERRKFNEMAQAYNTNIRTFPRNIFASMFGFEKKAYFQAAEGAETAPKVEF